MYLFICLYIWYLSLSVFSIYPCFIYLFICLYVWYLRQSVCFYIQFHLSVLLATGHLSVYLVIEWVCLSHFTCLACRSYNLWYPLFLRVYVQLGTYPPFIGLSTWHPPPLQGGYKLMGILLYFETLALIFYKIFAIHCMGHWEKGEDFGIMTRQGGVGAKIWCFLIFLHRNFLNFLK